MKILTTLDGSPESSQVLPIVTTLAKTTGATVLLLTVCEPSRGVLRASADPIEPAVVSGPAGLITANPLDITEFTEPKATPWAESKDQGLSTTEAEGRDYLLDAGVPLEAAGIKVETRVITAGNAPEGIIDVARQEKADIVAMATHGRSGFRNVVHGSVANAVVKSGVAPVLLVRCAGTLP